MIYIKVMMMIMIGTVIVMSGACNYENDSNNNN